MREIKTRDPKKKERLQRMAKMLRETDTPIAAAVIASELNVGRSTITRYCNALERYLDPDENLEVATDENGTYYYKITSVLDKYNYVKTEEGYMDPTASAAMNNYVKDDTKVKDWKYNAGDLWQTENSKGITNLYVIVGVYTDKAVLIRAYDYEEQAAKQLDLNDPNLVVDTDNELVYDTSFICTKPFRWLMGKFDMTVSETNMNHIKARIGHTLGISGADVENEELALANNEIEDLSKALEKANKDIQLLQEQLAQPIEVKTVDRANWDAYDEGFTKGRLATYDRILDALIDRGTLGASISAGAL